MDVDVLEAMSTARSMRWLRTDPVDDESLETILRAATYAPSSHNCQPWRFVVVRDPDVREQCGRAIAAGARNSRLIERISQHDTDRNRIAGVQHLAATIQQAPVVILACGLNLYPPEQPDEYFMNTAVHAACQNLLVAARSVGLGAAFTMLNRLADSELRRIVGVPDHVSIVATIPIGWPDRPFGPVARKPLEEVVSYDRWPTDPPADH